MATSKTLSNLSSPDIALNSRYSSAIDSTTRTALASLGAFIDYSDYTLTYEDICEKLFVKIGLSLIKRHNQVDKFGQFHAAGTGKDIEEIHIGDFSSYAYDKTGSHLLGVKNPPTINVDYTKQQRRSTYSMSIYDKQFKPCFNNLSESADFITEHFNRMLQSIKKDNFTLGKHALGMIDFTQGNMTYQVPTVQTASDVQIFLRTLKKASMDMTFNNSVLCEGLVDSITPLEDQILFINKDVLAHVDVDILAGVFNLDKIEIANRIIVLDDFGDTLENCCAILMDRNKLKIYDDLYNVESFRNGEGMFTNYFYNIWQTYRISPYSQAIKFEYTNAETVNANAESNESQGSET